MPGSPRAEQDQGLNNLLWCRRSDGFGDKLREGLWLKKKEEE